MPTPKRIRTDYEYRTITTKNKKSKGPLTCYVTSAQRRDLIEHLGMLCYIVFEYYTEKSGLEGFDYHDSRVAKALGLSERQVQRARGELTKHGWFYQSPFHNKEGKTVILTFLGQAAVHSYRTSDTIRITINDSTFIKDE